MLKISLNGTGSLEIVGRDAGLLPEGRIAMNLPGTVYGTLLEAGLIPDPFYRDNELKALPLMENDFVIRRSFTVTGELLACSAVLLRFDGIDTLADIYLNDVYVAAACNMHRIWEYMVGGMLREGENELKVVLHSPTRYIEEQNERVYTGGSGDCMKGFPHLRKAHCMFGWDWGPRLPDAGIFRGISLLGVQKARLQPVCVRQLHEERKVTLEFDVRIDLADITRTSVKVSVTAPDGAVYRAESGADGNIGSIVIENPRLWWPRGYGEQPLYGVRAELCDSEGALLDVWEARIGLRTLTVNTDADEWGNCFAHEVNGVKIFAMGADYIPEDNLFGRINRERTRKLLEAAAWANHNCIRVWGGGYYPDDYFYDICDELGLIVWQDFMFACASYELDEDFEENVSNEIIDNVRRIRHHACLGLWCGNNEMETQTLDGAWRPSIKQKADYIKLFEYIIPKLLREEDPMAFYWPSSPSSGGNYDNPWDENRGDAHYWDVWHGYKPFTEYRKFRFRYVSEFGFQSFPCMRTVESFTLPEDRNVFSRVMEMHQRSDSGNGKMLSYLSATYLYPSRFEDILYASQLLQADAIRYGVEHFRRHRGRCMGTVVWQLNDIWPVASWAGIDYYGRWKALHYAERRMFAPIMISCEEIGELSERPCCTAQPAPIEKSARLHVANETPEAVSGVVEWELRGPDSAVLERGEQAVSVAALDGVWLEKLDFGGYDERAVHLSYRFRKGEVVVSEGSCLFTPPKHYYFADPHLTLERDGDTLTVRAQAYARCVEIVGVDGDCRLSDNYFDMEAGARSVTILKDDATPLESDATPLESDATPLKDDATPLGGDATAFACRSVYDIGR
ncbi:MAG: glycoside hydrolase family 2 protein [Roseburia sp.]|nr:glycoside hydrolase family 2 protein [Roseburia sp.]